MARPHRSSHPDDQGIALIMVMVFTVLLYVMVAELVTTAQMQRLTGENDALLARMRSQMRYNLDEVFETLINDAESAAAAGEEGGAGGGGIGPLGGGAAGGGEEPDPAASADCSRDAWYEPIAYSDGELTTNVWVEDENRKFNLLALISPDREFADESKDRFIRLIDSLREKTDHDLSVADGETIYDAIIEWMEGRTRTEALPRPLLKSDSEERRDITAPLHLDELLMLRGVTEHLYYDQIVEDASNTLGVQHLPGLESVLTVYTSLRYDQGDPQKLAAQGRQVPTTAPGGSSPDEAQPEGVGIRINVNTAIRPVLRCLFPPHDVPDAVIEAILRYRNEKAEEEEAKKLLSGSASSDSGSEYLGDVDEGVRTKLKVFEKVEDLDNVPEFANLANTEVKSRFFDMITTKSDVFTVHLAALYRRNEERREFVIRRGRSVVVRSESGDATMLYPLILLEDRAGLKIMPRDFPQDELDRMQQLDEMDEFAREEREWNPFFIEFYRPRD
jgi:type II secretory pathway component PulK